MWLLCFANNISIKKEEGSCTFFADQKKGNMHTYGWMKIDIELVTAVHNIPVIFFMWLEICECVGSVY